MTAGKDSSDFAAAYKRTVVVSPTGTDTQNGQALLNALSGIRDASATKTYLLYIEPGTYNLGTTCLPMRAYVDIQGAGELNTLITSGTSDISQCIVSAGNVIGTVAGANNAELRFLTVRNTGRGPATSAILNSNVSPRLTHVTAEVTEGTTTYGVFNINSSATMTDVTATASGQASYNHGVYNEISSPTMTNVTATGSGGKSGVGVLNLGSSPTITHRFVGFSSGSRLARRGQPSECK